jgi:hypothetical protein
VNAIRAFLPNSRFSEMAGEHDPYGFPQKLHRYAASGNCALRRDNFFQQGMMHRAALDPLKLTYDAMTAAPTPVRHHLASTLFKNPQGVSFSP